MYVTVKDLVFIHFDMIYDQFMGQVISNIIKD